MPSPKGNEDASSWLENVLLAAIPDAGQGSDGHEQAVRRIVQAAFGSLPLADQDDIADWAEGFYQPVKVHWRDHAPGKVGEWFTSGRAQQMRAKIKDASVSCGTTSLLSLIAVGLAAGYLLSRTRAVPRSGGSAAPRPARTPQAQPNEVAEPVFAVFGGLWDQELAAGLRAGINRPISESHAVALRRTTVVWRAGKAEEIQAFDRLFELAGGPQDEYDWIYVKIELRRMDARLQRDSGEHARCSAVDGLAAAGAVIRGVSARVPNRVGADLDFWRFQ